jgi:hypothetical protein
MRTRKNMGVRTRQRRSSEPIGNTVIGHLHSMLNCSCSCGHSIAFHHSRGCQGVTGRHGNCTCTLSAVEVLDAALELMGGSPYKPTP